MKFILASALIATCYATAAPATRDTSTMMYMKLNFHCPAQGAIDGATPDAGSPCVLKANSANGGLMADMVTAGCVESNIQNQFLVVVPYSRGAIANNRNGNCINFVPGSDTANAFNFGAVGIVAQKSMSFVRHATADTATVILYDAPGCVGASTLGGVAGGTVTGFHFNDAATQGKFLCAGNIDGTRETNTDWGLEIGAVAQTSRAIMSASRWTNKKTFAGQIMGPFATNKCTALPGFGPTVVHYPIVMPLEDAPTNAPQANPATTQQYNGELAISATNRCWNSAAGKTGAVSGEAVTVGVRTANAASFSVKISSGTNSQRVFPASDVTGKVTCTDGDTISDVTYTMDYTGVVNLCVESINAGGSGSGSYFLFAPADYSSIGLWTGNPQIPAGTGSGGAASPASSLHLSAAVAAMIGFMNMLF